MKKGQKSMLVLWIVTVFIAFGLFIPGVVGAGYLEPPTEAVDEDGDPVSTMRTLEEVYNKTNLLKNKLNQLLCLEGGGAWITSYRDFDEDGYGDPNDTMEDCSQPVGYVLDNTDCDDTDSGINPGEVEVFGNGIDENCDGIVSHFTDLGNSTVRDNITGLIWLKNANPAGRLNWNDAIDYAGNLVFGGYSDWRLPTKGEWEAFVNTSYYDPALSNAAGNGKWSQGDAFYNVQSDFYWSSTASYNNAWFVFMLYGDMNDSSKTSSYYVWPVRGSN
jgi:hypothetical protein